MTFANELEKKVDSEIKYKETIKNIQDNLQNVLRKNAHVSEEIIAQLPIVTAGHTDSRPILKYEAEECRAVEGWDSRLFLTALIQVEPEALPALFEVRWSWKDLGAALAGGGSGAAVGGGVGAGVGALFGLGGGPVGSAIGALTGTSIGTVVGGLGGAGIGMITFHLTKFKSILKTKLVKLKLKRKQNASIPY